MDMARSLGEGPLIDFEAKQAMLLMSVLNFLVILKVTSPNKRWLLFVAFVLAQMPKSLRLRWSRVERFVFLRLFSFAFSFLSL
jgi:hypothetical protein